MNSEKIIGTAIGAAVALKILDTGMKIIDKKSKKVNFDGNLFGSSKKNNKWY